MKTSAIYLSVFFLIFGYFSTSQASQLDTQEIGQMMFVGFYGTTINAHSPIVEEIKKYHIGGIIIFNHEVAKGHKTTRNISSPQQLQTLINQLQFYAHKYHDRPLFIGVNQEGGLITTLKPSKGFKLGKNYSQAELGQLNNQRLIAEESKNRAILLKKYGINLDFAPVADLAINPNNPGVAKLERSYGSDPIKVTRDLTTTIKAYQKEKLICTLKHFPGLGSARANPDFAVSNVTNTWQKNELYPYQYLIKNKKACQMVMVTPLINEKLDPSGTEATLSKPIVTGLLRKKLKFNGLIITDDMDAAAIRKTMSVKQAIKKAVLAGNDIILYGGTQGHNPYKDANLLFNTLQQLAQNNPTARKQIQIASLKIINFKNQHSDFFK